MKIPRGLKLEDTTVGTGRHAVPGDTVRFEYECRLNRGDLISDSTDFGPYQYRLGCRDCSPGVEYGLMGMRTGGVRQIKLPPHLTYVDRQINPEIPKDAVVRYTLRLVEIVDPPWDPDMATRLDCSGLRISG
ncbi:FKBP-type peptidyl-prolyl cis-trans isomerase [Rosistilla oblonga]|uniref:Peptidyl-prolyl cis-trans isomerase n=2 Tax=Rosistilla oblonga TaxID=2527990 RepID=A0A518J121_9BACT|nr:FKBP-type peptidyl-prolyl cis-trans isomerase [Rosistilla oblonga]QDV59043.1 FK506-binding protein [Rosistilla oblonga]